MIGTTTCDRPGDRPAARPAPATGRRAPLRALLVALVLVLALPFASRAQGYSLATTANGTAIHFYGLALARAADAVAGLDLRPVPYRSAGQGAVFVNRGETDFGLFNAIVLKEAYDGREFYEGRALTDIRLVARLMPFQLTFGARGGSGIATVADLAGTRFPTGFDATAFGDRLYAAMLATGGLTLDDVTPVPVADWAALGKAFVRGEIDVNGLVVGSATAERYAQQVAGFHAVSLGDGPEAEAALQAVFPSSRLVRVEPAEGLAGIDTAVMVMEYDYWVYAHKDTDPQAVTRLLESLAGGSEILTETSPDFRAFDPGAMQGEIGIPFHPAAVAFFSAQGARDALGAQGAQDAPEAQGAQ